jgi:hypothetical protein
MPFFFLIDEISCWFMRSVADDGRQMGNGCKKKYMECDGK